MHATGRLRGTEQTADVGVSVDDTWFSSALGVLTAISIDNGKVLDVAIFSNHETAAYVWKNSFFWSHSLWEIEVIS